MNNDLISRDALKRSILKNRGIDTNAVCDVFDIIDNAPTVEITETEVQEVLNKRCMTAVANEYLIALHGKRPQGEWVIDEDTIFGAYGNYRKCSICNEDAEWLDGGSQFLSKYCPNCGAKMQKGGAE